MGRSGRAPPAAARGGLETVSRSPGVTPATPGGWRDAFLAAGEGNREAWARLHLAGIRACKRRVLRLMRENAPKAASRVGSPRGPRRHDGTIIPEKVDVMRVPI